MVDNSPARQPGEGEVMSFFALILAILIAGLIVRHFGMILEVVGIVTVLLIVLLLA